MTNSEKFKEVFGYDGTICVVKEKGRTCGYNSPYSSHPECNEERCASRHFPRCPLWWDDEFREGDLRLENGGDAK